MARGMKRNFLADSNVLLITIGLVQVSAQLRKAHRDRRWARWEVEAAARKHRAEQIERSVLTG